MKRVIGITGGVGCGKSTVLSILKNHFDAEIFMADDVGHEVFEKSSSSYQEIVLHFGDRILDGDGEVLRSVLAEIIFQDEAEKVFLDDIVHPFVIDRIRESIDVWMKRIDELYPDDSEDHLFVLETALMFETGCESLCDEVWGVAADESTRIDRLMKKRGYSYEKANAIISSQMPEEELRNKCDRIILNNSTKDVLEEMVCRMVENDI